MKVLVSTEKGQGQRSNDFCFVPKGELVRYGFVCDSDKDEDGNIDPDSTCGCGRSWTGVDCHKGTTTVEVVERPFDQDELERTIFSSMRQAYPSLMDDAEANELAKADAANLAETANRYPVGTVLELRGDYVQVRVDEG